MKSVNRKTENGSGKLKTDNGKSKTENGITRKTGIGKRKTEKTLLPPIQYSRPYEILRYGAMWCGRVALTVKRKREGSKEGK